MSAGVSDAATAPLPPAPPYGTRSTICSAFRRHRILRLGPVQRRARWARLRQTSYERRRNSVSGKSLCLGNFWTDRPAGGGLERHPPGRNRNLRQSHCLPLAQRLPAWLRLRFSIFMISEAAPTVRRRCGILS